jgi:3',5'-cyclic AMP phosphodiesterase CpdA
MQHRPHGFTFWIGVWILGAAACSVPPAATYPTQPTDVDRFCVLNDVRRTHPLNFWSPTHDRERNRLVRAVAAERPSFVAMNGDFVFYGSSARQWAWFDRVFAPLRQASIPIIPTLGNHEYIGSDTSAMRNYFARFPSLKGQKWYRRNLRSVALLMLDSNRKSLGPEAWKSQRLWFASQLAAADRDPRVRAVLVFLHHPPYTNSSRHSESSAVKRDVVPLFLRSRKGVALVGGHVHSYERFLRQGKTFLNSGGGGATPTRLRTGAQRRHTDDRFAGPAVRSFHYLSVRFTDAGLAVTVRGLRRGAKRFHVMERFTWPWPAK